MLRYRLLDPRGNDLGPYVSREVDYRPGDRIRIRPGEQYVVLSVLEADTAGFHAYLVVETELSS
jgi:hypothetical protein